MQYNGKEALRRLELCLSSFSYGERRELFELAGYKSSSGEHGSVMRQWRSRGKLPKDAGPKMAKALKISPDFLIVDEACDDDLYEAIKKALKINDGIVRVSDVLRLKAPVGSNDGAEITRKLLGKSTHDVPSIEPYLGLSRQDMSFLCDEFIIMLSRECDLLGARRVLLKLGENIGFSRVAYTSFFPANDNNLHYIVINNFLHDYVDEYITGTFSIACPGIINSFRKNAPLLFDSAFNEYFIGSLDKRPQEAREMVMRWHQCRIEGLGFVFHINGPRGGKTLLSFFQEHFDEKADLLIKKYLPLALFVMPFFHDKVMDLLNLNSVPSVAMSIKDLARPSELSLPPSPIIKPSAIDKKVSHYQCGAGKLHRSHPLVSLI